MGVMSERQKRLVESSAIHYYQVMDQAITAAEANRSFSRLLREVREEGRSFVVTSHGTPVAKLVPCAATDAARETARLALLSRLAAQPVVEIGRWSRDELYER